MKKVCIILLGLIASAHLFAIDTLDIKGYYVIKYPKEVILNIFNNKLLFFETGIRRVMMDFVHSRYFVPLQVDTMIKNTESTISNAIMGDTIGRRTSSYYKDNVFYFTPHSFLNYKAKVENSIQKYFGAKVNLYKATAILTNIEHETFFYSSKQTSKYLYTVSYIEGKALKTVQPNYYKNLPDYIDAFIIKKEFNFVELYYIIEITKYNPIVEIEGFDYWYPYIDN